MSLSISMNNFENELGNEAVLVDLLKERKYLIATAESCTGGLIAATIVNVSGSSEVFHTGIITYANESKVKELGVDTAIIDKFGAVSEEVAIEMAKGVLKHTGADVSVSVTGIAGPSGATEHKPIGLVYISCNILGDVKTRKYLLQGNRKEIREETVRCALQFVIDRLKEK